MSRDLHISACCGRGFHIPNTTIQSNAMLVNQSMDRPSGESGWVRIFISVVDDDKCNVGNSKQSREGCYLESSGTASAHMLCLLHCIKLHFKLDLIWHLLNLDNLLGAAGKW